MSDTNTPERKKEDDRIGETFEVANQIRRKIQEHKALDQRSHRYLSRIAHAMDVGVLLLDEDLQILFASERTRELLVGEGEILEESWAHLRASEGKRLRRAARQAGSRHQMAIDLAGSGLPTVRLSVQRFDEEDDTGYLVMIRDALAASAIERDLQLASQLQALMGLFMGLTHDLRAPLNAMVLNLELLRRSWIEVTDGAGELATAGNRRLKILEEELHRLERSLDRLLAQTIPARPDSVYYDIGTVVREIGELLAPQARQQKVALEIHISQEVLATRGSPDLIKQALVNLAVNGFEAQPEGGRLVITAQPAGDQVVVLVADEGPGISASARDHLFELHFTTKKLGTGLGLHVTRAVVESQGGRLQLEKTGPEGTTFELRLPADTRG